MMTPINPTLESFKFSHLPILPAGVPELISAISNEENTSSDLANIIERFPSIAARLIMLANSAWSSPTAPVNDLITACSRLGFNVIRNVSIALAVSSPFSVHNCPSFNVCRYWCRALLTAEIAQKIADMLNKGHLKETARTAGLLHNLGLLWIADQVPESIHDVFIEHQAEKQKSLLRICEQSLGFHYAEAGAHLGLEWGLPEILVVSISDHYTLEQNFDTETAEIVAQAVAVAQFTELADSAEGHDNSESVLTFPDNMVEIQDDIIKFASKMLEKNQALANQLFNS